MSRDIGTALRSLAIAATAALWASSAEAIPTPVDSLAAFNAAIGGATTTTDPFDNAIAGAVSITFDTGVMSTLAGGNLGFVEFDNRVIGGEYMGTLDGDGAGAPLTLTWIFPFPVIGFGAEFQDVALQDATILGTGTFFDINTVMGGEDGFFGIVDTMTPFTSVQFSIQASTFFDSFDADNLVFAAAEVPGAGDARSLGRRPGPASGRSARRSRRQASSQI